MVEFAIALPVLMMLAVGMFSGGAAYNRKASLATASREVSRYGATLPVSAFPTLNAWLTTVVGAAQKDASGDLDPGTPQLRICVSYFHPAGATSLDTTETIVRTSSGDSFSTTPCFDDGRTDPDERRVQVQVEREADLEAVVFTSHLHLVATSLTHFEAQ
jgi:hypothetical protein